MLIPTIAMALTLNNAYPASLPQYQQENTKITHSISASEENTKITRSISASYDVLNFEAEVQKFTPENALNNLKNILTSDLNKIEVNKSQAEVEAEINKLLNDMNDETLKLARLYKALEAHTVLKSGLCPEEIYENSDYLTTQIDAQHYLHNMLDKLNLLRLRATENDLDIIHKKYNDKILSFSIPNGDRDLRSETEYTLYAFQEDIKGFIFLGHEPKNGTNNHTITSEISMYLQEIQYATSRVNFNENDYKNLVSLMKKGSEKFPKEIFGNESMTCALLAACFAQSSFNELLTNLDYLGYDLNGLIKQEKTHNVHDNQLTR